MKQSLFLLLLFFTACKEKAPFDCKWLIPDSANHYGFMEHGELLSNKPAGLWICHIPDLKDWKDNEYFTGYGFSKNKDSAFNVPVNDTCALKEAYFLYLKDSK